jgi:hypothetical protein
MQPGSKEEIQ